MKTIGLLLLLAGFVLVWGVGYKGLTFQQLQADINSWVHGGPTLQEVGGLTIQPKAAA